MRTIRLYGPLAERIGQNSFSAVIGNVAESIRFLIANFPDIESFLIKYNYTIFADKHSVAEDEIHYPVGSSEDIHIIPVIAGSGATGRIIAGVALIAASFALPGATLLGVSVSSTLFGVGASLALGGVAQLLSPKIATPGKEKDPKQVNSYSISGVQNTSREGIPVNLVYGEIVTGAIIISAGVTTVDISSERSKSYGAVPWDKVFGK
jgi:hypothetical protein